MLTIFLRFNTHIELIRFFQQLHRYYNFEKSKNNNELHNKNVVTVQKYYIFLYKLNVVKFAFLKCVYILKILIIYMGMHGRIFYSFVLNIHLKLSVELNICGQGFEWKLVQFFSKLGTTSFLVGSYSRQYPENLKLY